MRRRLPIGYPFDQALEVRGHALDGERLGAPPGFEGELWIIVVGCLEHCTGDGVRVLARDQADSRGVGGDERRAMGGVGADDGKAAAERLDDHVAESLVVGGEDEDVCRLEVGRGVGGEAGEMDVCGEAQRAREPAKLPLQLSLPKDGQLCGSTVPDRRKGPDQEVVALLLDQPAHCQQAQISRA